MLNEETIAISFSNVKKDMGYHMQFIEELREENLILRQKIESMKIESIDPEMLREMVKKIAGDRKESKSQSHEITIKIDKHSRNAIKDEMLLLVEKRQVTLSDLKEIIVDINRYCSKATFYRYYDELRLDNLLEEDNESRQKFLKSKRKIEVSYL